MGETLAKGMIRLMKTAQLEKRGVEKTLVTDLTFEVIKPSGLGKQAYTDPHVREIVTAIRNLLIEMKTDPVRRDSVIYRFEGDILPEVATQSLYEADVVIVFKRGTRLVGYAEINRETNEWLRRERYEGDILVDPAAYQRDEAGNRVEKGIGKQALHEMHRQGRLMGIKNIEIDVYLRNLSMQHFLNHLIETRQLPLTKQDMAYGRPLDYTYILSCEAASDPRTERPS